jgi:hypothetical protein
MSKANAGAMIAPAKSKLVNADRILTAHVWLAAIVMLLLSLNLRHLSHGRRRLGFSISLDGVWRQGDRHMETAALFCDLLQKPDH